MKNKEMPGKIIIMPGVKNILPWEMHSAIAIAKLGLNVAFQPEHNFNRSADAFINGTLFEFKSPEGKTIKSVQNNLQKALRYQSKNIVIDSSRMKNVRDNSIKNYLMSCMRAKHGIKKIIFINRRGEAVDISKII